MLHSRCYYFCCYYCCPCRAWRPAPLCCTRLVLPSTRRWWIESATSYLPDHDPPAWLPRCTTFAQWLRSWRILTLVRSHDSVPRTSCWQPTETATRRRGRPSRRSCSPACRAAYTSLGCCAFPLFVLSLRPFLSALVIPLVLRSYFFSCSCSSGDGLDSLRISAVPQIV